MSIDDVLDTVRPDFDILEQWRRNRRLELAKNSFQVSLAVYCHNFAQELRVTIARWASMPLNIVYFHRLFTILVAIYFSVHHILDLAFLLNINDFHK